MNRVAVLLLSFAVASCSGRSVPPPEELDPVPTSSLAPDEPAPRGRLGNDVRPSHYSLELHIEPQLEQFDGTVSIDVELAPGVRVGVDVDPYSFV